MTDHLDVWDRRHEEQHPEEYYLGYRLLPVIVHPAGRAAIDVYDLAWGVTLCTVSTVEAAKGWIDGQMDVAERLFWALFEEP